MSRAAAAARSRAASQPLEYSLLMTATLCLLAFGTVMVFSASSATSLLGSSGDSVYYLKRTLIFGAAGLVVMRVLSLRGVRVLRALTPALMAASIVLLLAVLVPGLGIEANGARRWIGTGLFQVQPSELAKLALVLYAARLAASRPAIARDLGSLFKPLLVVTGGACLLIVAEPDLGTAVVIGLTIACLLVAAGVKLRHLALIAAALALLALIAILIEPYRRERLLSFLAPGADPGGAGFQATQATIALGSGGLFGVGVGESVQKVFYLPEAHTDMILAVIGEEWGLVGIAGLIGLYAMIGYAGFRAAKRARDRYSALLAAGLTSMILVQAALNFFAVMGMAPLTGVPLPFVSYGNSDLLVMMAAVGLLLNVARRPRRAGGARRVGGASAAGARAARAGGRAARLRVVEGGAAATARGAAPAGRRYSTRAHKSRDSRGWDGGARRARAGGRRRAAG